MFISTERIIYKQLIMKPNVWYMILIVYLTCALFTMDWKPEPQSRLTASAGRSWGMPARKDE